MVRLHRCPLQTTKEMLGLKKVQINNDTELNTIFTKCSSYVKYVVGIGNNAAWAACLDSMEHIRQHPYYKCQRKGGTTPEREFCRCFNVLKSYERTLIYTEHNRFFRLSDMPPKTRAYYGNITDREYYDYWAASGFQAFQDTRPFFTSLVNKLRLAYEAHGVTAPDKIAWANAAGQTLYIASDIFTNVMDNIVRDFPNIGRKVFISVFKTFDLHEVARMWASAVDTLDPKSDVELTDTEHRNIQQGYVQLAQQWTSNESVFGSREKVAKAYEDIFRTNGTMLKSVARFRKMKEEASLK